MKKALPYIIIGILVILVIWISVRQKGQKNKVQQQMPPGTINGPDSSGSSPVPPSCTCEQDPEIQRAISLYNKNQFPYTGPTRLALKAQIEGMCPCAKI